MGRLRAATALGLAASLGVSGCGALLLGPRGGAVAPRDCPQAAAVSDSVFLVGDAGAED